MKLVPSITSTDKSVCATRVAQTLLSVLWQYAVPEVVNLSTIA